MLIREARSIGYGIILQLLDSRLRIILGQTVIAFTSREDSNLKCLSMYLANAH